MRPRHRGTITRSFVLAVLAVLALLALLAAAMSPVTAASATAASATAASHTVAARTTLAAHAVTVPAGLTSGSVTVTVTDVSPNTPARSYTAKPLRITLNLHNNTKQTLRNIQISGDRGDPIVDATALNSAIAKPQEPSSDLVAHIASAPAPVTLPPASDVPVVFKTTTDIPQDAGLCLCHDAIYPLYFTASYTDGQGTTTTVGAAQTYLPVFGKTQPQPVQVSWVWPLLERPHRILESGSGVAQFLDDDLATAVGAGGRLDRMLQVAEDVAATVHLTLVLDPELIDELAVMSTGAYRVPASSGTGTVVGTGSQAAASWLARLRAVMAVPGIEVSFTPFADPDVESLTENRLSWSQGFPSAAAVARVTSALGGPANIPAHDIEWPLGESLGSATLTQLVRHGTRTVLVNEATLAGSDTPNSTANALSPLTTSAGRAVAAVTDAPIQKYVSRVLSPGGTGLSELPQLISEVAIHAVESPRQSHLLVLTPPRYADPQVSIAVRAIRGTANTLWSQSIGLRAATKKVTAVARGRLRLQRDAAGLPDDTVDSLRKVSQALPVLTRMFTKYTGTTLLGPLSAAMQRAASSGLVADPQVSIRASAQLATQVGTLLNGVRLVKPATDRYTLTSTNSLLPVTIENSLNVRVYVQVNVSTVDGLAGLIAQRPQVHTIGAGRTEQFKVPTAVVRTGRLEVLVTLSSPQGTALGSSFTLSVHSTALGTVGVAITTVAGVVLVLALVVRAIGYLRRRKRPRPPAPRVPDDVTA